MQHDFHLAAGFASLAIVKTAVRRGLTHTILPLSTVADDVADGRVQAVLVNDDRLIRRVLMATSMSRPTTPASFSAAQLAVDVIVDMVKTGFWPAKLANAERGGAQIIP